VRTLLEIFQTESDDAEISNGPWIRTVKEAKELPWVWDRLNEPFWQVKRRPRTFEIKRVGNFLMIEDFGKLKDEEIVKVVEVIEND